MEIDNSFKDITCHLDKVYLKKVVDQTFSSEDIKLKMLQEGFFFPKVKYSFEPLQSLIHRDRKELDSGELSDINDYVKLKIHDGNTVFLSVNRFFYPLGREANRTHLIHPVFIIGYDDDKQSFIAIEDCISPGTLDYYELPYESVNLSCESISQSGKKVIVTTCKVKKQEALMFEHQPQPKIVVNRLHQLLNGGREYNENYDLHYDVGLSCLESFTDELEFLIENLRDASLFKIRILSFFQTHGNNLALIKLLRLNPDQANKLVQKYSELQAEWELFKNQIFYAYAAGSKKAANKLPSLRQQMVHIKNLEEEAAVNFLEILKQI